MGFHWRSRAARRLYAWHPRNREDCPTAKLIAWSPRLCGITPLRAPAPVVLPREDADRGIIYLAVRVARFRHASSRFQSGVRLP
jgi:hypothetical protein